MPKRTWHKGRGALSAPAGRFESVFTEALDDGWGNLEEPVPAPETTIGVDRARRVIAWNESPDVPFDRSINPWRGCEHGCIYCFARPSHAWYGLSPGQDFETRLFYKQDAARLLEEEIRSPGYEPAPITLGANTDPYQPIERSYRVTRSLLETLTDYRHPVSIVTKGALVERDLDLLQELAAFDAVSVMVSLTSMDAGLKRLLEPRAAAPGRRLRTIERLTDAGIPVGTLIAPVIPALTDHELERLLEAAADAGARSAGYVLLRLPHEVEALFTEWLRAHYPDRADRVLNHLRDAHGGACYEAAFGHRMRGSGPYADLLARRFRIASHRAGIDPSRRIELSTQGFRRLPRPGDQTQLF
ncbi:MAG: PA0069 family radical SAM protein [Halofilum sp. (in: g-proteobacteria)]